MALTPSMYPSTCEPTFTLLPDAQVLAMKKEDRDFMITKLAEIEDDIKKLRDCAPEAA